MNAPKTIFRAYDIRGRYPTEISDEATQALAKAFCTLYPAMKTVVLAHDPAPVSPRLAAILQDVCASYGKQVIMLGMVPDPLFSFALCHRQYDGGIMVSSSHVIEFTGFTLAVRNQETGIVQDVVEQDLERIRRTMAEESFAVPSATPGTVESLDVAEEYATYIASHIHLAKPLRAVIDCGNGAMGMLPEKVFTRLGCQVETLYGIPDGTYPNHRPDPYLAENLRDVQRRVLETNADMGVAYDADGDRIALIDNTGRVVSGDSCLLMLARQAVQKKKGPVVHDMRVSQAFLKEMKAAGVETFFSVSHHNAVIKKIHETNAVFGGEVTLHFLFPLDYYLADDALLASLKLAEIAAAHETIASYVDTLPRSCMSPELFIETPDEVKFSLIEKLQAYLNEHNYSFIGIDGARIAFEKGWALARAANTSPFIKCRFEGETQKDLERIEQEALQLFIAVGIPVQQKHYQELGLAAESADSASG